MKRLVIIALAAAMALSVAVPALAVSPSTYTFEMAARMLTDIGWQNKSQELTKNQSEDVGSWFVNMPGHSYLRARFYSVDKNVGGRIELGLKSLQPEASVSLRYAYGYWRVGRCRILAGQTDNWFGSLAYHVRQYVGLNENAHLLMFGWGFLWPHRVPQVQFTYNTDKWGIQFAVEEPRSSSSTYYGAANTGTDYYYNVPRLSLTAMFKFGGFMTHPGISYVNHQYEAGNTGQPDHDWATWAIVLPIKFTTGPFTVKFQGHWGQNFGTEYPFYPSYTRATLNAAGTDVSDTDIYGGVIAGEYKIGKIMITAGFGYENFQNDQWSTGGGDDTIERWGAFIAVPYQFTKNFGIHPEFSYYDYDKNPSGTDGGNEWLLGVQFRFVF
ncbi:MAG: porin [Deltaproteobacteria bacterium]|nr:porin [Deltaproteobacteria bacterium]